MGLGNTSLGITIGVMVFMFCFELVNVTAFNLTDVAGGENVTLQDYPDHRSFRTVPVNRSRIIETPQANEESQIQYASPGALTIFFNVINNGTTGFSEFMHVLLGVPNNINNINSVLIDFAEWFILLNHAIVLLQIVGKIIGGLL